MINIDKVDINIINCIGYPIFTEMIEGFDLTIEGYRQLCIFMNDMLCADKLNINLEDKEESEFLCTLEIEE